jgi:hypothetical protein
MAKRKTAGYAGNSIYFGMLTTIMVDHNGRAHDRHDPTSSHR